MTFRNFRLYLHVDYTYMEQFLDDPRKYIRMILLVETSTSSYHLFKFDCVHTNLDYNII